VYLVIARNGIHEHAFGAGASILCVLGHPKEQVLKRVLGSIALSAVVFAAGVLIGCGGGGGGGGSNGGGDLVLFRVELPGRDALNLIVGDDVQFELAGYDSNNKRTKLTADSWALSNVQGNPGVLSSTGEFSATGIGSADVVASYKNKNVVPLHLVVHPANNAWIAGSVKSIYGGAVSNVIVVFYDNGNTEVGRARTNASGAFGASVPLTATKVNLDPNQLPPGWYKEWLYRTVRYSSVIANCHALVVLDMPLSSGVTSHMNDPIYLTPTTDPPPPPPDGC
jgi:hypothetical protein